MQFKNNPSSLFKLASILLTLLIINDKVVLSLSSDFNSLVTHPNTVQGEDTTSLRANNTDGTNSFEVQTDGDVTIGISRTSGTVQVKSPATFDHSIFFEGSTDDAFELEFRPVDPTADRIINVPNAAGTLGVSATSPISLSAAGDIGFSGTLGPSNLDLAADYTWTGSHTHNGPNHTIGDAVTDSLTINSAIQGNLIMDGATNNTVETTLTFNTSDTDRTITFPDASGTVAVSASSPITLSVTGNIDLDESVDYNFTGSNFTIGNSVNNNLTITSAIQGATAFCLDGATSNERETCFSVIDPTDDRTLTIGNEDQNLPEQLVKGWITFGGDDTASIGDSYNVSGVVRNAEGAYTITWSPPFTSINYAVVGMSRAVPSVSTNFRVVNVDPDVTPTASALKIVTQGDSGTDEDSIRIEVIAIGNNV